MYDGKYYNFRLCCTSKIYYFIMHFTDLLLKRQYNDRYRFQYCKIPKILVYGTLKIENNTALLLKIIDFKYDFIILV